MDQTYTKPFILSVQNVFSTMLQARADVGEARPEGPQDAEFDISAIIGLSGSVQGCAVLRCRVATAEQIVSLLSGREIRTGSPDFADAFGEIINMICGGAKAMFPNSCTTITSPRVVIGTRHATKGLSKVPCVVTPFSTPCGPITLEIAIKPANAEQVAPPVSVAA
jgi:chemotaxis protein CheX